MRGGGTGDAARFARAARALPARAALRAAPMLSTQRSAGRKSHTARPGQGGWPTEARGDHSPMGGPLA